MPGVVSRASPAASRSRVAALAAHALAALALLLAACATTTPNPAEVAPDGEAAQAEPRGPDPWQRYNRVAFAVNDRLDRYLFEPLAKGWDFLTPRYLQTHLDQVFRNLNFPGYFVNDLLQAEARQSGVELGRFVLNTTVGVAGFFDPASRLGLQSRPEDFGQTLAVWGVGDGPYVVVPILTVPGATLRDFAAFPINLLNVGDSLPLIWGGVVRDVNRRTLVLEDVRQAREAAFDWYVFTRDAQLQRRHQLVSNGAPPAEEPSDDLYELDEG